MFGVYSYRIFFIHFFTFLSIVDAIVGIEHIACEERMGWVFEPVLWHWVDKRVHFKAICFAQFVIGGFQTVCHFVYAVGGGTLVVCWTVFVQAYLMYAEHQCSVAFPSFFVMFPHAGLEIDCCHAVGLSA